jgi:hypothetical protein
MLTHFNMKIIGLILKDFLVQKIIALCMQATHLYKNVYKRIFSQ